MAILRVKGGLDYSNLTEIDEINSCDNSFIGVPRPAVPMRTSPSSALMMHSDSNLSLANVGVAVTEESGENTAKGWEPMSIDDETKGVGKCVIHTK